jgi:hypothetical protein
MTTRATKQQQQMQHPLEGLSDPKQRKLQAQATKLERQLAEQEAEMLERVACGVVDDTIQDTQTKLANLYASTIQAKMKVLECVVDT